MKKISAIVPVYNVEGYLEKCLDSLVNQTLKEIEIIVVNDGSKDNSQEIIDKYVKKYPKIMKSIIKENGGQGSARNIGMDKAKGEYISFIDSDDFVELDMFAKMYNKAKEKNSDIVICGNKNYSESYSFISQELPNHEILLGKFAVWNKIYKRKFIVNNDISFRCNCWYEDLDFTMDAYLVSNRIDFVDECFYNYLIRFGSTMNNNNIEKNLDLIDSFDSLIEYCNKKGIYEQNKDKIEFVCIHHIYIYAISRILNTKNKYNDKLKIINEFKKYMSTNFPYYKYNKYLKLLPKNHYFIFKLINNKLYLLLYLLLKINQTIKKGKNKYEKNNNI